MIWGAILGLLGGPVAGYLVRVISGGESTSLVSFLLWSAGIGLAYGALFGFTIMSTPKGSHLKKQRGFVIARLVFIVPVCILLVFLPGALAGLIGEPGEFGARKGNWSTLNILFGFMLSAYIGVLWVRLLSKGR